MTDKSGGIDFGDPGLHGASPPKHASHPHEHGAHLPAGHAVFPLFRKPSADFHTGARYFGAPRSGGRLHAAVDLIAPYLSPIRAIADGRVIQAPYYFYLGTNALEVDHGSLGVVRYGEISSAKVIHLGAGHRVKRGEVIAYVGLLDGLGWSMLHFELYKGTMSGPLTVVGNPPYQRRGDLVNPTHFMERLLRSSF
ncbi:MAG: M23 family metallopeptidase [Polyangiaceae bacterium]